MFFPYFPISSDDSILPTPDSSDRAYNFGSRGESARTAVERFKEYMRTGGRPVDAIYYPRENITILDSFIDVLENAGFVDKGTISHEEWTEEAEQALARVLENFEEHSDDWQQEVSKTHENWSL